MHWRSLARVPPPAGGAVTFENLVKSAGTAITSANAGAKRQEAVEGKRS